MFLAALFDSILTINGSISSPLNKQKKEVPLNLQMMNSIKKTRKPKVNSTKKPFNNNGNNQLPSSLFHVKSKSFFYRIKSKSLMRVLSYIDWYAKKTAIFHR